MVKLLASLMLAGTQNRLFEFDRYPACRREATQWWTETVYHITKKGSSIEKNVQTPVCKIYVLEPSFISCGH